MNNHSCLFGGILKKKAVDIKIIYSIIYHILNLKTFSKKLYVRDRDICISKKSSDYSFDVFLHLFKKIYIGVNI